MRNLFLGFVKFWEFIDRENRAKSIWDFLLFNLWRTKLTVFKGHLMKFRIKIKKIKIRKYSPRQNKTSLLSSVYCFTSSSIVSLLGFRLLSKSADLTTVDLDSAYSFTTDRFRKRNEHRRLYSISPFPVMIPATPT